MFCPRCGEQVDTSNRYCPRCGQDLTQLTGAGKAGATVPLTASSAAPPQESEDAAVAEALKDEYELEKELGRGGMAVVYKARDKQLEREVAIKVLPFSLSFDAEFVERFQREARTAGKLEHPNIIPIYRVGKSGRVIYFVMKYIRGKSLSAVIEGRGALPVAEIKRFLIECTRALGYAHKHGIVHRDIKPDNIMFDDLGQAIVTDFGIAKAQSGARLTGTGMSIGTPHYMSPEQARAQNLDGRSDIYSLGVVAYQCLTGKVPFDGEDSFSIGYKHIMEELPVPSLDTADQRDLFSVVQKMMAKKPDDRFQSADDLVVALESGAGPSLLDMSTLPTRAIEPFKPPTVPPKAPAMAAQPTTPLPRASASIGKPKLTEEEPAAAAAAPAPAAKRRPFTRKPAEEGEGKKGGIGGVIAALLIVGVAAGGSYYYFGMYRPQQQQRAQAQRDSLARAESLATVARADSLRRDSVQRADSVAQLAAHHPAPSTATPPPATASRPATVAAAPGTLRLGGQIPAGARVTINGETRTGTTFQLQPGRYQIAIDAQGYRTYTNTATVQSGRTASVKVTLTPAAAGSTSTATTTPPPSTATASNVNCAAPTVYQQNPGRACWDTRPVPNTRPQLQAPPSCTGRVTPANILVNVSVSGEAVSANISRASSCQEFTQRALAYVQDMTFRPSMKNGAAVAGWVIVPVTPSP